MTTLTPSSKKVGQGSLINNGQAINIITMRYKENIVQRCIQRTNTNQVSILYRETKKVLNNPKNTQGIMTLYLYI